MFEKRAPDFALPVALFCQVAVCGALLCGCSSPQEVSVETPLPALADDGLVDENNSIAAVVGNADHAAGKGVPVKISLESVSFSTELPDGVLKSDVEDGLSIAESSFDGFTVDESGMLGDGYLYALVMLNVENDTDQSAELYINSHYFAILDGLSVESCMFSTPLWNGAGASSEAKKDMMVPLGRHSETQTKALYVLDEISKNNPELVFVVDAGNHAGLAVEDVKAFRLGG